MPPEPVWHATYRVQLHAGFTFDDVAAIVDYLAALGVSHLYCSPILQAAPGSTHGYDVVDPARISDTLGGAAGFARLRQALDAHGMGLLLDIVPNHMAIAGRANAWWWDVLEHGPASRYAGYFDIDWDPSQAKLRQTILVPILGDQYGRVLEAGEITLAREDGSFVVRYGEQAVPVSPRTLDGLLADAAAASGSTALREIAAACGSLPQASATDQASVEERHAAWTALRRRLGRLTPAEAAAIDATIARINADPDALHALLERQNYRLAFWRTAGQELDYRRFFDISELVAIRVEDPRVFADVHRLVLELVRDGRVQGLRVDHPDGLRDPTGYLVRLRAGSGSVPIVAEKILAADEPLAEEWPVAGTTGYDFLGLVAGLFVDPRGEAPLTELYERFAGEPSEYPRVAWQGRQDVMRSVLAADLERLTATFVTVCERHRRYRDYTRRQLRDALRETLAALRVYRTYVRPDASAVRRPDRARITEALDAARGGRPDLDPGVLELLRDVLLLVHRGPAESELVARFQQLSASVTAKGVEDTAFYRYGRLLALNEVGGDPGRFGVTVEEFHRHNLAIQRRWPGTLLATSTHDTKRSEDVRVRIALLSEIPERWAAAVWRWAEMNDRHRREHLPDRGLEYVLYQTVVGAFPLPLDRAVQWAGKAVREAKRHTSWIDPQPAYEEAVRAFVAGVLGDDSFGRDLTAFVMPLLAAARTAALAQRLLQATAPGIPDVYQGTELWDLSLVDPDNRRPVDFAFRRTLLERLAAATPEAILADADAGMPKLRVLHGALTLRRERPAAFGPQGEYQPLAADGARAAHVVAYLRGGEALVLVPRLVLGLGDDWQDTTLTVPAGRWQNVFTGEERDGGRTPLGALLARFPVALLRRR